jgi:hypothetical protein
MTPVEKISYMENVVNTHFTDPCDRGYQVACYIGLVRDVLAASTLKW